MVSKQGYILNPADRKAVADAVAFVRADLERRVPQYVDDGPLVAGNGTPLYKYTLTTDWDLGAADADIENASGGGLVEDANLLDPLSLVQDQGPGGIGCLKSGDLVPCWWSPSPPWWYRVVFSIS